MPSAFVLPVCHEAPLQKKVARLERSIHRGSVCNGLRVITQGRGGGTTWVISHGDGRRGEGRQ